MYACIYWFVCVCMHHGYAYAGGLLMAACRRWRAYVCTSLFTSAFIHWRWHANIGPLMSTFSICLSADVYMPTYAYACMMHTLACLCLYSGVGMLRSACMRMCYGLHLSADLLLSVWQCIVGMLISACRRWHMLAYLCLHACARLLMYACIYCFVYVCMHHIYDGPPPWPRWPLHG